MLAVDQLSRTGLAPVTFTLDGGECVAVRGPSGAGKSLLLRAIADLDPADGRVSLDGVERHALSGPAWRRLVGYVPAEPGWWAERAADHFADWAAVMPMVRRFNLDPAIGDAPVARLSTGERQRLALVRALERQPRVLLLDEPTAALDRTAAAIAEALVAERRAEGMAVLWVSHDPEQAARIARRLLVVEAGRVREEAP